MLKIYQQTINKKISFEGIGLHTGKQSKISISPAPEDHGIIFKRVDLTKNNFIKAKYDYVSSARLCTTLENEFSVKVFTVEHLLAAIYISGIDNALIEINNEEVPIMDGSAKDFLGPLMNAEIKIQNKKRKYLKILKKVELVDDEKSISIEPNNSTFTVDFRLNYKNKVIGKQKNIINFHEDDLEEVYTSRTFCLFEDIEKIKKAGLAKGGSLDNALVVNNEKVMNEGGLRNENEFVNHKILDLAGDFILSGYRILGKVVCEHGGHSLSNTFLRKLMVSKSFTEIQVDEIILTKKSKLNYTNKVAVSA